MINATKTASTAATATVANQSFNVSLRRRILRASLNAVPLTSPYGNMHKKFHWRGGLGNKDVGDGMER